MTLQRERIVRAALALLDEAGLDQLTVRRLAEQLGVQNPALYWHFKNKQEVLNEMAKTMLADALAGIEPPTRHDLWEEWLAGIAGRFRLALLTHRDGARVIASAELAGSALLAVQEMALGVLNSAGFDPRTALMSVITLFDYTLGAAFEEQADPDRTTGDRSPLARPRHPSLDPARLPHLAAALTDLTVSAANDPDVGFKWGIRLLLAGMVAVKNVQAT